MARQEIDLTTPQPNGKMGEPTKSAWEKVNDMTEELYAGIDSSSQLPGRNMLINCGAPINQRSFAGGAIAAGVYGYDRWKGGPGGCNFSINATTGVFTHTSGIIQQIVENPYIAWGRPLTISVEDPTSSVSVSVGGASGTITAGSGRRSVTVTPSGSGNMTVQLGATGATYSRPQLERGSVASSFDARPIGQETQFCKRYFRAIINTSGNPFANGSVRIATQFIAVMNFEEMRATPTPTQSGPLTAVIAGSAANASAISVAASSSSCLYLTLTVSGQTPGQAGYIYATPSNNFVMTLDSEL